MADSQRPDVMSPPPANRLFLACTPRTGNTWFRKMVAQATGGVDAAAHSPSEIAWESVETPCIVAMHCHRTPAFQSFLADAGFDVLTMVRHPLDVLVSILHFSKYEPATARWLEGEGGDESPLRCADPTSAEFLDYALSRRAALLLNVSSEWYSSAREVVHYERLVADTAGTLDAILRRLGCSMHATADDVAIHNSLDRLRRFSKYHFWRGEPGLWRRVIPASYQLSIYEGHRDLFELWGYPRPDESPLLAEEARETWSMICAGDAPKSIQAGGAVLPGIHSNEAERHS